MADPRVDKLARVLVDYSLELKPGQKFWLRTTPLAEELSLAVYEEAVKAGTHIFLDQRMPGAEEIFLKYASDEQLDYVSPIRNIIIDTFDAELYIEAVHNSRSLSGIDGSRIARTRKAGAELFGRKMRRSADGSYRWCLTVYPTHAMAQEADLKPIRLPSGKKRVASRRSSPLGWWAVTGLCSKAQTWILRFRSKTVTLRSRMEDITSLTERFSPVRWKIR
jgi:leucyl aminopeptidase (aminopeptidase T)